MGMTESWQGVLDAHAAKYPDSIFTGTLTLTPAGDGQYMASMSVPEGRVQATSAAPEDALDLLAADLADIDAGDEMRTEIKRRDLAERKRRAEAEAVRAQTELDAIPEAPVRP